jgi:hypothetical protein
MEWAQTIREQASALRLLATHRAAYPIRHDLLRLAERSEELAEAEREIKSARKRVS